MLIARWKLEDDGEWWPDGKLRPGHEIALTTHDVRHLPLPHPLLFQLHAIVSRVMALKAAAGFPLFPGQDRGFDDECGVPAFIDTTFLRWQAQHRHQVVNTLDYQGRYDSGSNEHHITRWFELTPQGLPASRASDSASEIDNPVQERQHSDFDDEPPTIPSVVLSEVGHKTDERWSIAEDRWMQVCEEDSD